MIQLEKGANATLKSMSAFYVGLGWDVREDNSSTDDFDLDVCAFMLGANDKIISDDYFVFYNSEKRLKVTNGKTMKQIVSSSFWSDNEKMRHESRPTDPEMSVIGSIDDEDGATSEDGDDETMDIDLNKVRSDIQKIIICVSIYHAEERHQNFGQVERAYVRLYKEGQADGDGEYIYDLTEDFSACTAVEFCSLYRNNGEWKVKALGNGYKGGLNTLLQKYA